MYQEKTCISGQKCQDCFGFANWFLAAVAATQAESWPRD